MSFFTSYACVHSPVLYQFVLKVYSSLQVMSAREMSCSSPRKFMRSIQTYPISFYFIVLLCDVLCGTLNSFVVVRGLISNRFDKVTRHGRILGKRTVAGRVVKESYGAAKQQHTFTVSLRVYVFFWQ